ncbi:hypothetical protein D910_12575 [Dendroctonus ponderosae]|uniref:DUF4817 domain-containing protein n=1 Tax=Dendroctonus ponderosae TaxID=77166 RepID=U4UMJ3_DENPD|nr:hypothetical protein D910_12575 [Dendroctonus ponderosae]
MKNYPREERIDMIFTLGECHKNYLLASRVYAQKFAERNHPKPTVFKRLLHQFEETRSVYYKKLVTRKSATEDEENVFTLCQDLYGNDFESQTEFCILVGAVIGDGDKITMNKLDNNPGIIIHYYDLDPIIIEINKLYNNMLNLICRNQQEHKSLSGTYLVTIPTGCLLKSKDISITNSQTVTESNRQQPIIFLDFEEKQPIELLPTLNLSFHLQDVKLDGLHKLRNKIENNHPNLFFNQITKTPSLWTIFVYVVLFVLLLYVTQTTRRGVRGDLNVVNFGEDAVDLLLEI